MKTILDFGFSILNLRFARTAVVLIAAIAAFTSCQPGQPATDNATTSPPETASPATTPSEPAPAKKLTIGVMPKLVGIPFFTATEKGAKEAGAPGSVGIRVELPFEQDVNPFVEQAFEHGGEAAGADVFGAGVHVMRDLRDAAHGVGRDVELHAFSGKQRLVLLEQAGVGAAEDGFEVIHRE